MPAARVPAAAAAPVSPFAAMVGELSSAPNERPAPSMPKGKALPVSINRMPAATMAPPTADDATAKGLPTTQPAPAAPTKAAPLATDASSLTASEDALQQSLADDAVTTAPPEPPAVNGVPIAIKGPRSHATTATGIAPGSRMTGATQVPFLFAPIPLLTPPPPPKPTPASTGPGPQDHTQPMVKTDDPAPPERMSVNDAALEVRIKAPHEESNTVATATAFTPTPDNAQPIPVVLKPVPELPPAPQASAPAPAPAVSLNPAATVPTTVAVRPPETNPHPAPQTPPSNARSTDIEEPVTQQTPQQPLRSVSLEFSPDGAGDVRLRLSEKAGEVHITLHSSDSSLTSRLHEGVHDLVGALSSAGYEAEAWTPGQGHQGNQREPEQRKSRRAVPGESGEAFGEMFPQSIQEIS